MLQTSKTRSAVLVGIVPDSKYPALRRFIIDTKRRIPSASDIKMLFEVRTNGLTLLCTTMLKNKNKLLPLAYQEKYLNFLQGFSLNSASSVFNTIEPERHRQERGSLNWPQLMLQWFIRYPEWAEFFFHLGKTLLSAKCFFKRST